MKKFLSFICIIFICPIAFAADMTPDKALSDFTKANFAYKDGDYDKAVEFYEKILKGGLNSGAVYYNLGNSYFKKGSLGKAILNYERAKIMMPRDSDLRSNCRYALSLTKNSIGIYERQPLWKKMVYKAAGLLTFNEFIAVAFMITFMIGIIHILSLHLSWPGRSSATILSLLILILFVCLAGFIIQSRLGDGLSIVIADTESKFEPREDGTTHFNLFEGNKVKMLKREGVWVKVERLDGKVGWVPRKGIEEI